MGVRTYVEISLNKWCDAGGLVRDRVDLVGSDVTKDSYVQTPIEGGSTDIRQCTDPWKSKILEYGSCNM